MLRNLRIFLAAFFFVALTFLFFGIGQEWWGWVNDIQIIPNVVKACSGALGWNLAIIAAIIILTLLFGRFYCSIICPLGIFQDSVNWLSSRRKGKKRRFRFHKELKWLRYAVPVLLVAAFIADIQIFIALVDPYSAYGRIIGSIVKPAFGPVLAAAVSTVAATGVCAWLWGREYCNAFCPVGTFLGLFSRFAIFKVRIDTSKCVNCHSCEKDCKSSCIDSINKTIDYSRCIVCMDCISSCKVGAISFAPLHKTAKNLTGETDGGRRAFLAGAVIAGTTLTLNAQEKKLDGGLAAIQDKKEPVRTGRLVPFGAVSAKNFYDRCTSCQLCVSVCPNGVLRPSTDFEHLMQPVMSYKNGFCRPECSKCSEACPAGAILPITPEEKTSIHIGHAAVDYDLCIVNRDGVSCGNCARHCPVGAIAMVHKIPGDKESPMIPSVMEEKCIGCGACEYLCPSRPFSAIHVNGLDTHIID